MTPSFEVFGPKECVIQLQIGNEEISTTWVNFNYFLNTRAIKSLAYGPGCMAQEVSAGNEVEFTIQARNDLGENRTSGRDVFEVNVCQYKEDEDGKRGEKIELESAIEDLDNGKYIVRYTAQEETDVHINVEFLNDKGVMVPLRGSPYKAKMKAGFKATDGQMVGEALKKYITSEIKRLQDLMQMTKNEINTKDKDKNIKSLEEEITFFTQEMRKREFFQYKCGVKIAIEKLGGVFDELKVFEDKIDDYGDNAKKFG